MQQLHLVGVNADLDSLIFSSRKGSKSGGFKLPLNEELLRLITEALQRRQEGAAPVDAPPGTPGATAQRRQSLLSPREIQARLRAGRSIGQVAAEAAVDEEWVARFLAPVAAERSQVVAMARQLVYAKPRRGPSAQPLGTAVRWNLAERGVRLTNDEFDGSWSAYQVANHTWMVTFSFVSRRRSQQAQWEVELGTGELASRNRLASDLAYVEPGRRRRSVDSLLPGRATDDAKASSTLAVVGDEPAPAERARQPKGRSGRKPAAEPPEVGGRPTPAAGNVAPAAQAAHRAKGAKAARTPSQQRATAAKRKPAGQKAKKGAPGGRAKAAPPAQPATAKPTRGSGRVKAAPRTARIKPATKASPGVTAARTATPVRKTGRTASRAPARGANRPAAGDRASGPDAPPAPPGSPAAKRPTELEKRKLEMIRGTTPTGGSRSPSPRGSARPTSPSPAVAPEARGGGAHAPRPGPFADPFAAAPAPPPAAPDAATPPASRARSAEPVEPRPPRDEPLPPPPPGDEPASTVWAMPAAPPPGHDEPVAEAAPPAPTPPLAASEPEPAPKAETKAETEPEPEPEADPFDDQSVLDIGGPTGAEDDAEGRRAERRRARAARANGAAGAPAVAAPPAGEPQTVTIRASRAAPPIDELEAAAEVILPPDRPALRPAKPAAQPRRRRFGRSPQ